MDVVRLWRHLADRLALEGQGVRICLWIGVTQWSASGQRPGGGRRSGHSDPVATHVTRDDVWHRHAERWAQSMRIMHAVAGANRVSHSAAASIIAARLARGALARTAAVSRSHGLETIDALGLAILDTLDVVEIESRRVSRIELAEQSRIKRKLEADADRCRACDRTAPRLVRSLCDADRKLQDLWRDPIDDSDVALWLARQAGDFPWFCRQVRSLIEAGEIRRPGSPYAKS